MSTPETDDDAIAVIKDLHNAELAGERGPITLGPFTAFVLIGLLQLTLRHPHVEGNNRAVAEMIIGQLKTWFEGTPTESLLAMGDDPVLDRVQADAIARTPLPQDYRVNFRYGADNVLVVWCYKCHGVVINNLPLSIGSAPVLVETVVNGLIEHVPQCHS